MAHAVRVFWFITISIRMGFSPKSIRRHPAARQQIFLPAFFAIVTKSNPRERRAFRWPRVQKAGFAAAVPYQFVSITDPANRA